MPRDKTDTHKRIVTSAKREFLEQGFDDPLIYRHGTINDITNCLVAMACNMRCHMRIDLYATGCKSSKKGNCALDSHD